MSGGDGRCTWPPIEPLVRRAVEAQEGDVVLPFFLALERSDVRQPEVVGTESELIDHVVRTPRVSLVEPALFATRAVVEGSDGLQWAGVAGERQMRGRLPVSTSSVGVREVRSVQCGVQAAQCAERRSVSGLE